MNCLKCDEIVYDTNGLHCKACFNDFHFVCGGIASESKFRKMNKRARNSWLCLACKSKHPSNSSLPTTTNSDTDSTGRPAALSDVEVIDDNTVLVPPTQPTLPQSPPPQQAMSPPPTIAPPASLDCLPSHFTKTLLPSNDPVAYELKFPRTQASRAVDRATGGNGKSLNNTFTLAKETDITELSAQLDEKSRLLFACLQTFLDKKLSEHQRSTSDQLQAYHDKHVELCSKYDELISTVQTYSETYDYLTKELKETSQLKKRIEDLESKNSQLTTKSEILESKYDDLEQRLLNRECEIRGVVERPNENLLEILSKIKAAVNADFSDSQVIQLRRGPPPKKNNNPRPILVEFTSTNIRDRFLESAKTSNKSRIRQARGRLSCAELALPPPSAAQVAAASPPTAAFTTAFIYISESLTPHTKRLLGLTRQAAKTAGYQFVWTKAGRVYLRKSASQDDKPIRVMNENILSKL